MSANGYDYSDAAYDSILKEADRDTIIGEHQLMVTDIIDGEWEPGRPYRKLEFRFMEFEKAKVNQPFNQPISEEEVKALKGVNDQAYNSTRFQMRLWRELKDATGKTPYTIEVGDTVYAKISRGKAKNEGQRGFPRIDKFFKAKSAAVKKAEATPKSDTSEAPPF